MPEIFRSLIAGFEGSASSSPDIGFEHHAANTASNVEGAQRVDSGEPIEVICNDADHVANVR